MAEIPKYSEAQNNTPQTPDSPALRDTGAQFIQQVTANDLLMRQVAELNRLKTELTDDLTLGLRIGKSALEANTLLSPDRYVGFEFTDAAGTQLSLGLAQGCALLGDRKPQDYLVAEIMAPVDTDLKIGGYMSENKDEALSGNLPQSYALGLTGVKTF